MILAGILKAAERAAAIIGLDIWIIHVLTP
jgi:hypothetical protein